MKQTNLILCLRLSEEDNDKGDIQRRTFRLSFKTGAIFLDHWNLSGQVSGALFTVSRDINLIGSFV